MKQRVISALVALIILIPIIIKGGSLFIVGCAVLGVIGFRELMNLREKERKVPLLIKTIGIFSFLYLMLSNVNTGAEFLIDYKSVSIIIFLTSLPIIIYNSSKKYNFEDAMFVLGSVFFLGIAFNYLITVRLFDLNYLIFLMLVTISTDTFAYTTGTLIGRHKMCPSISPKKTWEGFIGGLLFGTFISTIFYITAFDYTGNIFVLILVISLLSTIAQAGDLVFSSIKRFYNTKDYGNIMPGHGGVLDRLDSILFVVLAFSFIMSLI